MFRRRRRQPGLEGLERFARRRPAVAGDERRSERDEHRRNEQTESNHGDDADVVGAARKTSILMRGERRLLSCRSL
jgi:hypothetical protein